MPSIKLITNERAEILPAIGKLLWCNRHEWETYSSHEEMLLAIDKSSLLWVIYESEEIRAFFAADIVEYPTGYRALSAVSSTGLEIVGYVDLFLPEITLAAKITKCSRIEMTGRKAWERILSKFGVKPISQNYILEV